MLSLLLRATNEVEAAVRAAEKARPFRYFTKGFGGFIQGLMAAGRKQRGSNNQQDNGMSRPAHQNLTRMPD